MRFDDLVTNGLTVEHRSRLRAAITRIIQTRKTLRFKNKIMVSVEDQLLGLLGGK